MNRINKINQIKKLASIGNKSKDLPVIPLHYFMEGENIIIGSVGTFIRAGFTPSPDAKEMPASKTIDGAVYRYFKDKESNLTPSPEQLQKAWVNFIVEIL